MKKIFPVGAFLLLTVLCNAQTVHKATGTGDYNEVFYDSQIDPNDGGTISVGTRKYVTSTIGDVFMVKFNAAHTIVWQKTRLSSGDAVFNKVRVCANGDYLVAGKIVYNNGIRKAVLCRINSSTGDIIWSCVPNSYETFMDVFWDMVETSSGKIAVIGSLSTINQSYIALVSSSGVYSASISAGAGYCEFKSIAQLPNGNLIVAGYLKENSNYITTIVELNPTTLARISQNSYSIDLAIPGSTTVKSLWPVSFSVINNTVLLSCIAFPAFSSAEVAGVCIYNYDLTTRTLTGNFYYEPGYSNATDYSFFPLTETDFLLSQTYTLPSFHVAVSRIINGAITYERKINGSKTNISSLHAYNGNLVCSGKIDKSTVPVNADGYNIFSSVDFPTAGSLCDVTEINSLASLASSLAATSNSSLSLAFGDATMKITLVTDNTLCTSEEPCVPVNFSNYTFTGNGNWSVAENWLNNFMPPAILPANSTITINPVIGGVCILNISQTISQGANLVIPTGTNFVVQGDITIDSREVAICNQVWASKNLDAATYRNGDPIPKVADYNTWATMTTGAYCYYNNDSSTYAAIFGKLYNWYAVTDPRGLAPVGWHIPSASEWSQLISCLGGISVAGGPIKEVGFLHWSSPNTGATNSTGFTGLPSGWRANTGNFSLYGFAGVYWSSTEVDSTQANGAGTFSDTQSLNPIAYVKVAGYAVRCVKD